ncbi:MAG: hypothetical protein R3E08_06025 [Thiotrichaceae bacterium]
MKEQKGKQAGLVEGTSGNCSAVRKTFWETALCFFKPRLEQTL